MWNLLCCIWEVDYRDKEDKSEFLKKEFHIPKEEVGCEHCRGTKWTPNTFRVITQGGTALDVVFNFCPVCGRNLKN